MNDRLAEILDSTRARIRSIDAERRARLREEAAAAPPPRDFAAALRRPGRGHEDAPALRVIGEIKRRSPSAGMICESIDVRQCAQDLAAAGCVALSVLTEPRYFGGSLHNLHLAREAVDLPLLRKDFILEPIQVIEARAHGADAVLLLAAAHDDASLRRCQEEAERWGMAVLAEAHGAAEMNRLLDLEVPILGLNARDLHTFEVDLDRVLDWAQQAQAAQVLVAESGIGSPRSARAVSAAPVDAALVGEGLMRGGRPKHRFRELFGVGSEKGECP